MHMGELRWYRGITSVLIGVIRTDFLFCGRELMRMTGVDGVRSTAKGILVHEGKVLLNRCRDRYNGDYYSLPGGGQEKYETLFEALRREMLEETGYRVTDIRFAGLFEEICDDEEYRREYPQYSHKMYHFFLCAPESLERTAVTEMDDSQIESEWVEIDRLGDLVIRPLPLGRCIQDLIAGKGPMFLGSDHVSLPHG